MFLNEINSLPLVAQAKVLRVVEDGVFERLGESRPTSVDVRLISAAGLLGIDERNVAYFLKKHGLK